MNLEEAIFEHLTNDGIVSVLISGAGGVFHIYPLRLPDGFPAAANYGISYTEVSQELIYPLLRQSAFQFNCFGRTFEQARDLANALDQSLNDIYAHQLGDIFGVTYIKFQGRSVLYDDVAKLYYYAVDVTFKF